jgi:uncharacterized protein (TIGR02246 family)
MRHTLALCTVLLTCLSATAHAKGPRLPRAADDSATVRRAIDAGNAQFIRGWTAGDARVFADCFADDGAQLAANGRINYGRDAIHDRMEKVFEKLRMQDGDITTTNVFIIGDTAYETGKWRFTFVSEGKAEPDSGRFVEVWKRQKPGVWKMWRDIGVPRD